MMSSGWYSLSSGYSVEQQSCWPGFPENHPGWRHRVRVVMLIWIRHKVESKERRGTGLGPRDSTSGESVEEEKLMQQTESEWLG